MWIFAMSVITEAGDYINKVNWKDPTWDIFLLLFFVTFAFFYGIFLGRDKIVHILISTIFSYIIAINTSFLNSFSNISTSQLSIIRLVLFIVLNSLFFFFLIKKSIFSGIKMYASKWWHVAIYSTVHTGLFISIILHILDKSFLVVFGNLVKVIFILDTSFLLWIFASIFLLIMLRGQES